MNMKGVREGKWKKLDDIATNISRFHSAELSKFLNSAYNNNNNM